MFGSVYTGLSGLIAFSRGLDVISNNVANLNTPGYKGSDLLFRDLFYRYQLSEDAGGQTIASQVGTGVSTDGTSLRFQQGDLQETGNATDVAIDGNGFFILRSGADSFYTRAGQFEFDTDGYLVARGTDARVAGIDASGNLSDISLTGLRTNPPVPTTEVVLRNNLLAGSTTHEVTDIKIVDSLGGSHTLKMTFTNNSVALRSWLVNIIDESGVEVATDAEIRFSGDGTPAEGFNTITVNYKPDEAEGVDINFLFGEPGSMDGATSFSTATASTLDFDSENGVPAGVLLSTAFDSDGVLTIQYTNGEESSSSRLALAWFNDLQSMRQIGHGMFLASGSEDAIVAAANESVMGKVVGQNVEISNVDLTREFTDLIVVQRGYQASSQVLTVSNEMMQELLDTGRQ